MAARRWIGLPQRCQLPGALAAPTVALQLWLQAELWDQLR